MGVSPSAFCPRTTSPAKNADGPGHPLYLLWSKKTTKGCRCYPSRKRLIGISGTIHLRLCRFWEFRTVASVHSPSCPSWDGQLVKSTSAKGLGHNFKDSDLSSHATCSHGNSETFNHNFSSVPEFPISIFKVESALHPASKENPFLLTVRYLDAPFRAAAPHYKSLGRLTAFLVRSSYVPLSRIQNPFYRNMHLAFSSAFHDLVFH
jgi:hypothetical protein